MVLDTGTLFTIGTCITGLLGLFLLMLWQQQPNVRALAWWGGAYLMGAAAVSLWATQDAFEIVTPELPSVFLFVACGMIWSGARLFFGRKVLPEVLFAGALVWGFAVQFTEFAASDAARVALSSITIALYAFFTAYELRRERRRDLASHWFGIAIPLLHCAVFLAPAALILLVPANVSIKALITLLSFETMIYVIGTAFIVVVMANERIALVHKTAAMTDPLTGLLNRRAFHDAAEALMAKCSRKSSPVSVLLFDLDHFKAINDRFGHAVGDNALQIFAGIATANLRTNDIICRLGGEEFAAIISGSSADAAIVAERLRTAFQGAGAEIMKHKVGATVSIGVATALAPVLVESLLVQADAALYRAKSDGRNRTELAKGDGASVAVPSAASNLNAPIVALR
jgi:diguanylate cyclase (GGDEF)-like protein